MDSESLSSDASLGFSQGRGFLRRRATLLGVLALIVCALVLAKTLGPGQSGPAGAIQSWTQAESKQVLAAYLAKHVKVAGFDTQVTKIDEGDNYWGLARQAGINIDTLIGFNLDMQHLNAYVGRVLLIPNQVGSLHQVQAGESVASIEKDYGVEAGTLRQANHLGWFGLTPGQVLFVPKAAPRQLTPEMEVLFANRRFFRSPLAGKYTSLLGVRVDPFTGDYKVHNGVDIKAPFNSLVAAAADGKVSSAGWNGGFGKAVVIEHANGFRTLYGHLNAILVRPGQTVKQYQYIGKVGMTGRTTGAHLHFSIWKDGKLQNPLKYLW
jgi:murein DD-endopeptidase MepM/ murein hydrolase activator NlpD